MSPSNVRPMPRRREPPQPLLKEGLPVIAGGFTKVFVFVIVFVIVFVFHDMQLTMPSEPAMAVSTARAILMILFQLICFDILV